MKMKVRYYQTNPTELLDGLASLESTAEVEAYVIVMNLIYATGGSILLDDVRLHRYCNQTKPKLKRTLLSLVNKRKLVMIGERITQERCEAEIKSIQERTEKRSKAGQKGGRPKTSFQLNQLHKKTNALSSEKLYNNHNSLNNIHNEDFNVFWQKYDKKINKKKTKDLYMKVRKQGVTQDNLLQGIKTLYQGIAEDKQNGFNRNPPSPYQWLKDERWEDEVKQVKSEILIKNPDAEWRKNLQWYRDKNYWNANWGAKPETERCEAPKHLLREFGFEICNKDTKKEIKNTSQTKTQTAINVK